MREENFIAFWIVTGFFMGLCVGFWKWIDPFDILLGVLGVTFFFYVIAHISVGLFIRFMAFGKIRFDREFYEHKLDYFYNQLLQRERIIDTEFASVAEAKASAQESRGRS